MWQFLKKCIPHKKNLEKNTWLQGVLGQRLRDPRLWKWDRTSVAKGTGLGLLVAFIPIPLQMVFAALVALLFRINLPITVAMTTINNPFTYIPINFFIYKLGAVILDEKAQTPDFSNFKWHFDNLPSLWQELVTWAATFGKAYFLGLLIVALGSAIIGYLLVECIWRVCSFFSKKSH